MSITKFDLVERTQAIGIKCITLCKTVSISPITSPLVNQLVRSSTSIGANYCEATEANSKKDFINKIAIAKKEAKETTHWLKMLNSAHKIEDGLLESLLDEVQQIVLIFSATINSSKNES